MRSGWYDIRCTPQVVASSGQEQYYMITALHSVIWCLPTAEVSHTYITMQEIWVLENEAIYVNLNFCCCFCCCAYCFMLFCCSVYTITHGQQQQQEQQQQNDIVTTQRMRIKRFM